MIVTDLPFNMLIGIKPSCKPSYLLMLENREEYTNHLKTVHASALFALAEATSGEYLVSKFGELPDVIPVVQRAKTEYKKPAVGDIHSKATLKDMSLGEFVTEFNQKDRALVAIEVCLYTEENQLVMQSVFEWFITKRGGMF